MMNSIKILKKNVPYPKMLKELAKEIGAMRTLFSQHRYKKGTQGWRGDDESRIQQLGIMGELIARDYCYNNFDSNEFKFEPLIEKDVIALPDLTWNDKKIDIKAVDEKTFEFRMNCNSYNNSNKKVKGYWFVKLRPNCTANHFIVPYNVISDWEVKEGYTPYFAAPMPIIK